MLLYPDALALLRGAARSRARSLEEEEVPLSAALGRVASRALTGREAVPPFDNSSMDGYALAAAKAPAAPARLPVLGTIMAGDAPRCAVETGGAWRIMTGAPLPAGCDAVIPVEKTRELEGGAAVELLEPVEPGDFVRGAGRDFAAGAEVCPAGTRLGARHLLALAAVGVARVPVRRKPRVALIATGNELISPEGELKPGQIRDSSSSYLGAAIPALGADFDSFGVVADDPKEFRARLDKVLSANYYDVVLTTGAVSMGAADFIPQSLESLGAQLVFHKTAIRPGKPGLLARFERGPLFFGLPGNPISTVVGLRFFVEPCLRELLGRPHEIPFLSALSADVDKPEGLRCFYKARRIRDGKIEILPAQASFQIHSLLSSDCWAVLPESGARMKEGSEVDVFPLAESLA
ncbi:MAG TPA: gephyrin-like molybdotransferase Glp [Elusimicrobiota bacterium]|jgi:molybdopterin molybdotransferase|nr:gephyrin-like molybdotransferase Glp [Elusimicrobiota bacterium]